MDAAAREISSMIRAIADVMDERQRQIKAEGYTAQHDDQYRNCQLSLAAAAYAMNEAYPMDNPPWFWPWPRHAWKPKNERRDLVRAAALLIARIEQIDRKGAQNHGA
ncbi:hypothetical protein G6L09_05895 [Agrobacterium rhizogenes]|nr:hypothetical protein [Rhizobium rhizogenes]NTH70090.1 hypothetical protein [Rhizobium rhizogenes]